MRHKLFPIAVLVLLLVGCAKKNQEVLSADSIPLPLPQPTEQPQPQKVQVATGELRELLLTLKRVHFSFDQSTLSEPARQALDDASAKLTALPTVALYVEGHTDTRGTTEYNLSLGERRARTVVNYLTHLGVESDQLRHVSYGEEKVLVQGQGVFTHAKNRRVDFRLMKGDIEFVLEESTLIDDKGQPIQIARVD